MQLKQGYEGKYVLPYINIYIGKSSKGGVEEERGAKRADIGAGGPAELCQWVTAMTWHTAAASHCAYFILIPLYRCFHFNQLFMT